MLLNDHIMAAIIDGITWILCKCRRLSAALLCIFVMCFREGPQELEEKLKKKVKRTVHCDFTKESVTEPHVLPKVDCVICVWSLGPVSKDEVAYTDNMRKLASLLRVGGHLLVFGGINSSSFTIGDNKHHTFNYDENTVRTALNAAGCAVRDFHHRESNVPDNHVDNTHIFYALAIKEREA